MRFDFSMLVQRRVSLHLFLRLLERATASVENRCSRGLRSLIR